MLERTPPPLRHVVSVCGALACLAACSSATAGIARVLRHEGITGQEWHHGPPVEVGEAGPARFVGVLNDAFDTERAMKTVRFTDRFYRAPANPAYDQVLDHLAAELGKAGFGEHPRLQIEFISTRADTPAWTPKRGSAELLVPGEDARTLHSFDKPGDVDRVMLPINAPSCDLEGPVVMRLEDLTEGAILVTEVPISQVLQRVKNRGALAVVSASLRPFNTDPSGEDRHRDAIQYRIFRQPPGIPVFQISPRSYGTIEAAWLRRPQHVRLHLRADVDLEERPLRTLVATIVGETRPEQAVGMSSHVQEPGACDNATGVAGLLESAVTLAGLCRAGTLPWPDRSLVFLWGDEFRQTQDWLDSTELEPVIGISSDMTGQSAETGAIALLERMPDPGAVSPLAPDAHTPWGAGDLDADSLLPNGLAVIARCAMVDVGLGESEGWPSADHPWEGGSDHDIYIERGIPAVLFWHFTDFTYHTSLDRLDFVDPQEMRRTAVALLSTALAVAHPEPADLDRYLASLKMEEDVRVAAAREAEDDSLVKMWQDWCRGAREWLRKECLGIDEDLPSSDK